MPRGERLNLRMDERLKKRVQVYCERKHLSVSELITQLLVQVLEEDAKQKKATVDAEQI